MSRANLERSLLRKVPERAQGTSRAGGKTSYPEGKAVQTSPGGSSSEGVMGRKVQSERRKAGVGGGGRGRLERPPLGALQASGRANLPGVLGPAKEPRDPPAQPRNRRARLAVISDSLSAKPLPFLGMRSRKARHTVGVQ